MDHTISGGCPEEPGLAAWSGSMAAISRLPAGVTKDVERALELAKRFNKEVVEPSYLRIDAAVQDDPDYLASDFMRTAAEWSLYSRWLPRMFGGEGWNFLSLYVFLEEISSTCVGLANVIGVHYLGAATLMATWNTRLMQEVFTDVCQGERGGRPRIMAMAITESGAGTDIQETALADRAHIATVARRESDGNYRLNGRKVFISNAPLSTWYMVIASEDCRRPADTCVVLIARSDEPGFEIGPRENKMGQKACPASELVFTDYPVPATRVAYAATDSTRLGVSHRQMRQRIFDYFGSTTRAGVGAFSTGVAWGSYYKARDYAFQKELPCGRMIEQQWVQSHLAEMVKNAQVARETWLASAFSNCIGGLFPLTIMELMMQIESRVPAGLWRKVAKPFMRHDAVVNKLQTSYLKHYSQAWQNVTSGSASLAKIACSDIAVKNAVMALELMGGDGLRQENGAEKFLRDAKLLQIYEGTNQVNRINLFKCSLELDAAVAVFRREAP